MQSADLEVKSPSISPQCRAACIKSRKDHQGGNWKGGRIKTCNGYVYIWNPEHPNASCGKGKLYVAEHRLVMSKHLGRPLVEGESVHHKNAIRDDNRLENLELMTKKVHRGQVVCPHCGGGFAIR